MIARLVGLPLNYWWMVACLGLVALSGPLWTVLFALLVRYAKRNFFGFLAGPLWSDDSEDVLLSLDAFERINKGVYVQGLLYFTIYFVLTMPLVILVLYVLVAAAAFVVHNADPQGEASDMWNRILVPLLIVIAGLVVSWTMVRPLGILFISCVDVPGQKFFELEFAILKRRIESAFYAEPDQKGKLLAELRPEWRYVLAELRRQETRVRDRYPDRLAKMLEDRSNAAIELAGLRVLLDENLDTDMLRAFARIAGRESVRSNQTDSPPGVEIAGDSVGE